MIKILQVFLLVILYLPIYVPIPQYHPHGLLGVTNTNTLYTVNSPIDTDPQLQAWANKARSIFGANPCERTKKYQ